MSSAEEFEELHFYSDYIKWQIFYGYLPFDIWHMVVVLKRFFVASADKLSYILLTPNMTPHIM